MYSNIFIKNINERKNIDLTSKQEVNVYCVVTNFKNANSNITINLKNSNTVNIYYLILANNNNGIFNINLNHNGNNSKSNIYVKVLANNKSLVKINCISLCAKKTSKNEVNQTIDGLMFDNESLIQALPCLDINTNDILAKHTVNIGQIDPEIIFYLNTKGLNENEAYRFIIDAYIKNFKPYLKQSKININSAIKKLIGDNNE